MAVPPLAQPAYVPRAGVLYNGTRTVDLPSLGNLFGAWDDFDRADGALGTSASGHAWTVSGGQTPQIYNGEYRIPAAGSGYAQLDCGSTVKRCSCEFRWLAGTDGGNTVTMITTSESGLDISDAVHPVFTLTGWGLQVRENAGSFVLLDSGTWASPMLPDGETYYTIAMEFDASTDSLTIYGPDGSKHTVSDSRITALNGRYCIWEPTHTNGSAEPRFKSVSAIGVDDDTKPLAYVTPTELGKRLSNYPAEPRRRVTFTNSTTGWHRLVTGPAIIAGRLRLSADGLQGGSTLIESEIAYNGSIYAEPALKQIYHDPVSPLATAVRISYSGGAVSLDVNLANTGTVIADFFGENAGTLAVNPASGASAGTAPRVLTLGRGPNQTDGIGVWDDFDRADGALGNSRDGRPWVVSGSQTPQIYNGEYRIPAAGSGYAQLDVGSTVKRCSAKFRWIAGTDGGSLAMITTSEVGLDLSDIVHFVLKPDIWSLQVREAAGSFVELAAGYLKTPQKTDGTPYRATLEFSGTTCIVYPGDGTRNVVTDSRIGTLNGRYCIWEPGWSNGNVEARFQHISAVGINDYQRQLSYATHEDVAHQLSTLPCEPCASVTFTVVAATWYRIITGPDQIGGTLRLTSSGFQGSGNRLQNGVFDFSANAYVQGSITQTNSEVANGGLITQVRTGYSGGAATLDVYAQDGGTVTADISGRFANIVARSPASGVSAGTAPALCPVGKGIVTTGGMTMWGTAPPATQPVAIPDTSGALLAALEAEVNKLKANMRLYGNFAT